MYGLNLDHFLVGSSVVSALPTLLYVGMAQRKNRISLINESNSPELSSFLSIPFETIIIGILVAYGITHALINLDPEEPCEEDPCEEEAKISIAFKGAILGLSLSLVGRFVLDLPVKMFNMSREDAWMVHPIAMFLYAFIMLYVDFIVKM